jgi:hypothetical protein
MKKQVTTNVRIPAEWLKISLADIMIMVTATINDADDYVDVQVREMLIPGYHCLNILPHYHTAFYELVEQRCMDAFTYKMDSEYDHEYYADYVL